MQPLQAIYTAPSRSESLPSTVPPSYHEQPIAHEVRVHHVKGWRETIDQYKGLVYAAILIAAMLAWTIIAWILYTPAYRYPWDHTVLANRSHSISILAPAMVYLSLVLPILAIVPCWLYYQFSRPLVSGKALFTIIFIMLLFWWANMTIMAGVLGGAKPTWFALDNPFVYPLPGRIGFTKSGYPVGSFRFKNETAVCNFPTDFRSPFKQIIYTIEESAISFEMTCPDTFTDCGHGIISYTDTQVDMDVYINTEMYHISSVSPKFRATPGPWKHHTSLYSSTEKLFLISMEGGSEVYGTNQRWRAFGSCWQAFVLSKWPKE